MGDKQIQNIHVLVAEDDNFQRLALIDILTLCDYQVTAVENGRIARDELLKEDSNIDIVLLDLRMPEMDGWELLCLMQKQERLKKIPVIMMSFGDETENVTLCLSSGAKDYLVKPLRIQSVKGLAKYVQHTSTGTTGGSGLVGIQQYQVIRIIGQGAGGSVELVKRRTDGLMFAMKTISMKFMNEQEKKMAQSEVTLLKVLVAPSIIRYYESFVENESIHIVMEYAEQGALSDKIAEHKMSGIPMDEDTILYFTAQVIISVLFMHSKKILHRDIKSQNLFMTKENIVKLGDFGISKALGTNADLAKTLVGTPYFMSPEVCSGETYGEKADIWALGCTLYEMVMLKRPFDNDNINVLFNKIRNEDPPPLHDNASADIRMLITFMLHKNPSKRPSVWDLAKIPSINKNIRRYYETEAPDDAFLKDYITGGPKTPISKKTQQTTPSAPAAATPDQENRQQEASTNTIEQTIKALSESLEPYDYKLSPYKVERNVINGEEIFNWFNQYYPNSQTGELVSKLEELVEKKYIHHISGPKFQNNKLSLYRFQSDMPGIPANHYKIWNKSARYGITVIQDIIQQANLVLNEVADQFTGKIDEDILLKSKKYNKFLEMVCELQKIYLQDMQKENECKCFFINLYQVMYFHKYLRDYYLKKKKEMKVKVNTIFDTLRQFFPFFGGNEEEFYYQIGYHRFNIDDIKHGLLRGNKRHQLSKFKVFGASDDRQKLVFAQDLRVLLLFKEENIMPQELKMIQLETIEEELDAQCTKFISTHVCFDSSENDLTLHKIFQVYLQDFGGKSSDVVKWISKYTKAYGNGDDLVDGLDKGDIFVQFQDKFEP